MKEKTRYDIFTISVIGSTMAVDISLILFGIFFCIVDAVNHIMDGRLDVDTWMKLLAGVVSCVAGVLLIHFTCYMARKSKLDHEFSEAAPRKTAQFLEDCSAMSAVGEGDYQIIDIDTKRREATLELTSEESAEAEFGDSDAHAREIIKISLKNAAAVPDLILGSVHRVEIYHAGKGRYRIKITHSEKTYFFDLLKWTEKVTFNP